MQGKVPSQWKDANVIPIPKQTPPSIDKLRPISLTPCLAKVAEGRVCKWIIDEIHNGIDHRQFGNQKGVSTTHCLIDVYHHLVSGVEKTGSISTLVLTDFSKAFDLIDHRIVVVKLLDLGVPPAIVQWVVDFLTNRRQRVKYKDAYSEWIQLSGGVPQGTIIGPIAFLGMINDALDHSQIKVWKYVDDLTLGENRSYDGASSIQPTLDNLHEWSVSNQLRLNPSKCHAMQVYFGKKEQPAVDLCIADHHLEVVNKVKLLGVTIQNDLKWGSQVDNIMKKANGKMYMLRKLKAAGLNSQELLTVYKGYIRPLLEYAAPLWHPGLTQQQVDQVEKIQKRVCKHILGRDYVSYTESLATLELKKLQDRRADICSDFAGKALASDRFSEWFNPPLYKSTMQLRRKHVVQPFRCNTERFKSSPLPYMANLLNS